MGLIKDIYSPEFYNRFTKSLVKILPKFNNKQFIEQIFVPEFEIMEWKERMQHTTKVLHNFMPKNYAEAVKTLAEIINRLQKDGFTSGLEFMFLPDYIAQYGQKDLKNSIKALEIVTQFISAEYAVRPFLLNYEEEMIAQMQKWSLHESYHVRRFSSEGIRPILPWATAIPALKKNPSPIFPILENLKNDTHEWVRRSVANNLNDISKSHPKEVVEIAKRWKGISPQTDALIKHACRTLLKQGNPEILDYYGLHTKKINCSDFSIKTPTVTMGKSLIFSFKIKNEDNVSRKIRLEYAMYFLKQNKQLSKKVFKISEKNYAPGEKQFVERQQSFKPITTRTYYTGNHQVAVIINGQEQKAHTFELVS